MSVSGEWRWELFVVGNVKGGVKFKFDGRATNLLSITTHPCIVVMNLYYGMYKSETVIEIQSLLDTEHSP